MFIAPSRPGHSPTRTRTSTFTHLAALCAAALTCTSSLVVGFVSPTWADDAASDSPEASNTIADSPQSGTESPSEQGGLHIPENPGDPAVVGTVEDEDYSTAADAPMPGAAPLMTAPATDSARTSTQRSAATESAPDPERTEVYCYTPQQDLTCSEDQFRSLITQAGSTPTRIVLGMVGPYLTDTVTIPRGADIELVNYPANAWGANSSSLIAEDGFRGSALFNVEEGATLTISAQPEGGEIEMGARGEYVKNGQILVHSRGAFVLNQGTLSGVRDHSGSHIGAVTVTGSKASFTMNGGTITDNHRRQDPTTTQNGAGNIAVSDGATFIMHGGLITDGWGSGVSEHSPYDYGEAGGVGLYNGGHMVMNGGEISSNNGFAGGILAMSWPFSKEEAEQTKESARNTVEINGGTITNNTSRFSGGGVFSFGNSVVTMNGGTITNNTAPNGGGVGTFDDYVQGAEKTWAEIPSTGKQAGYTPDAWADLSPAAFIMNGGTISHNSASRTGGGINIVSNRVTLRGGNIEANTAKQMGGRCLRGHQVLLSAL